MNLTRTQIDNAIEAMSNSMMSGPNASWLPPRPLLNYVSDTLSETYGFDITRLNPQWIPICITATVDWVRIAGWWPYYYSSTFHSGEEYQTVWKFRGQSGSMEMDPENYKIFRFDDGASLFNVRRTHPGLSRIERGEIPSFIRETYCRQLGIEKPPIEVCERAVWATCMWLLDTFGKDWLYNQSHIISSTQDFGMAFLHSVAIESPPDINIEEEFHLIESYMNNDNRQYVKILKQGLSYLNYNCGNTYEIYTQELLAAVKQFQEDEQIESTPIITLEFINQLKQAIEGFDLMDPRSMSCTNRPLGTCSNCGEGLWCVSQYLVVTQKQPASGHNYLCSACATVLSDNIEVIDTSGEDSMGKCYTCSNQQCPHIKVEKDEYGAEIPVFLIEAGQKRIEAYSNYILAQPTGTINGISAEDLQGYFEGNRLGQIETLTLYEKV